MLQLTHSDKNWKVEQKDTDTTLVNDQEQKVDIQFYSDGRFHMLIDSKSLSGRVKAYDKRSKTIVLTYAQNDYEFIVSDDMDLLIQKMGLADKLIAKKEALKAPMPGLILRLMCEEGMAVKKGDNLLLLEAMKMENILKASIDGIVKKIHVAPQTAVEKGAVLIEFE